MNLLTSKLQNKFKRYHERLSAFLHKPESRFIQEMSLGILKSRTVILNQIAISIEDTDSASDLEQYSNTNEITWIVGRDHTDKGAENFKVKFIPTLAYFDETGVLKKTEIGVVPYETLASWITER